MILEESQIATILKDNPNKEIINEGREVRKKMRMHVYGENLAANLPVIDGYEKNALHAARVKYARSNVDLFERLARPIDKVFTAHGGSVYYNLPGERDTLARSVLSELPDGLSVRDWMATYWRDLIAVDPYGVVLIEVLQDKEMARTLFKQNKAVSYPCYISIDSIFDYKLRGVNLEYLILNMTDSDYAEYGIPSDVKAFRVIDDEKDCIVTYSNEQVTIFEESYIPNVLGHVVGRVISGLRDTSKAIGFLSIFSKAVELAEQFLLKGSVRITHDFLHGFPKPWEYGDDCNVCNGTGWQDDKKCPECKGSGRAATTSVAVTKVLPYPRKDEAGNQDIVVAPHVGGYITPDETYYTISQSDLISLEDYMNITIWGTSSRLRAQGLAISGDQRTKTATEIVEELGPQKDRLSLVSTLGEKMEKFISDSIIRIQIQRAYGGSSINYGRRFIMESPDIIFEKYKKAKTDGVSQEVLNTLMQEYIEANFSTDPVRRHIALKLMEVEPFIHNTLAEVKDWPISDLDKMRKAFYIEWRNSMSPQDLVVLDTKELNARLTEYITNKLNSGQGVKVSLVSIWGVGGTQSFMDMLVSTNLSPQQKKAAAIAVFQMPEADAAKVFDAPGLPPIALPPTI